MVCSVGGWAADSLGWGKGKEKKKNILVVTRIKFLQGGLFPSAHTSGGHGGNYEETDTSMGQTLATMIL